MNSSAAEPLPLKASGQFCPPQISGAEMSRSKQRRERSDQAIRRRIGKRM